MLDLNYFEHDSSPLATQTIQFFKELEAQKQRADRNFWEGFCELNSSAPECRIYED